MNQKNLHYLSSGFQSWMTRLSFLIVMILIGTSSFAQQSGTVFVESNSELVKALDNPQVNEIILGQGDYALLNKQIEEGTRIITNNSVTRSGISPDACQVAFILDNVCWVDNTTQINLNASLSGSCPPAGTNTLWTQVGGTGTGTVSFDDPTDPTTTATATAPGQYLLQYDFDNGNSGIGVYNFYDQPVISATGVDECGTETILTGTVGTIIHPSPADYEVEWSLDGTNPGTADFSVAPGTVSSTTTGVSVTALGEYTFQFEVSNAGTCTSTVTTTVEFFETPDTPLGDDKGECYTGDTYEAKASVPSGAVYDIDDIVYYTTQSGTTETDFISESDPGLYEVWAAAEPDGVPCVSERVKVSLEIQKSPTLTIEGLEDGCGNEFEFGVDTLYSGGTYTYELVFNGTASQTVTTTFTYPFTGEHTIVYTDENDFNCSSTVTTTVDVQPNLLAGQVKYYNDQETAMPSPFEVVTNNQSIPDYFNVLLLCDYDYTVLANTYDYNLPDYMDAVEDGQITACTYELKKVEEYYKDADNPHPAFDRDDVYDAAFGFETNINPSIDYHILVWDGGMLHEPDNVNLNNSKLTETWTWNNWGGITGVDGLLITHMAAGNINDITDPQPGDPDLEYISYPGPYNMFAQNVADVSNSGTITGLDALLTARRQVNEIAQFPNEKPNFNVAGTFVHYDDFNTNNFYTKLTKDPATPPASYEIPDDYTYAGTVSTTTTYDGTTPSLNHWYAEPLSEMPNGTGEQCVNDLGNKYINIYYDASGDLNGSYYPDNNYNKSEQRDLIYEGEVLAEVDEIMTLPISIDQFESLAAVTLDLNYRKDLIEVLGVNYGEDFADINVENGTIRINWFDMEAKDFSKNAAIVEITVKVKQAFDEQTELFKLNFSELADGSAKVINDAKLKAFSVSTAGDNMSAGSLTTVNSPNPFKETTNIEFNLPESGKVQFVLYDMMGNVVKNILEQDMAAGQHNVELKANNLNPGVYQYRIILQGEKRTYSVIRSIVVM